MLRALALFTLLQRTLSDNHVPLTTNSCIDWTESQLVQSNPNFIPAEDAYVNMVASFIAASCMDDEGIPSECDIGIGDGTVSSAYIEECKRNGGQMWSYTFSPLCGDINSSSQTSVSNILVCASSGCDGAGVANLYQNDKLTRDFTEAGFVCGGATYDLKKVPSYSLDPSECQGFTKAHLYDPNPDLQPAEDAYIAMASSVLQANCIDRETNGTKDCEIGLGSGTDADVYATECFKNGGKLWSHKYSALCDSTTSSVENLLFCASASCDDLGVGNLIPKRSILEPFTNAGHTCGHGTSDVKEAVYVPYEKGDKTSGGSNSFTSFWTVFVALIATFLAY